MNDKFEKGGIIHPRPDGDEIIGKFSDNVDLSRIGCAVVEAYTSDGIGDNIDMGLIFLRKLKDKKYRVIKKI